MNPATLALLIPILGIVFGIGLAMLGLWFDYRRKRDLYELHHRERMAAIDKGLELPPLSLDLLVGPGRRGPTPGDLLRRGLILFLLGLALVVAMSYQDHEPSWWGLLPAAVGLAYLISYVVERKRPTGDGQKANQSDAGPRV